jgi:hypothetical protein
VLRPYSKVSSFRLTLRNTFYQGVLAFLLNDEYGDDASSYRHIVFLTFLTFRDVYIKYTFEPLSSPR